MDAGQGQVVARDSNLNAFFLSGDTWQQLPSANLKHVSVGPAGMWGVSQSDKIFKLVAGNWAVMEGKTETLVIQPEI